MFLSDEFWQGVFGAIIGGIITVLLLKLLDKLVNTANKSKKLPTEHDERF